MTYERNYTTRKFGGTCGMSARGGGFDTKMDGEIGPLGKDPRSQFAASRKSLCGLICEDANRPT